MRVMTSGDSRSAAIFTSRAASLSRGLLEHTYPSISRPRECSSHMATEKALGAWLDFNEQRDQFESESRPQAVDDRGVWMARSLPWLLKDPTIEQGCSFSEPQRPTTVERFKAGLGIH